MYEIRSAVDMNALATEVLTVPLVRIVDGSGSSHLGGPERWIRGLSMTRIHLGETYPLITKAVRDLRSKIDLGDTVQIMVNKLDAGGELAPHRDGYPAHWRFHLPVITHPAAYWWDEQYGRFHMQQGEWSGPVPYCGVMHSAGNPSPVARIHLVADFKEW
jgi:hypothetical protein